MIIDMNSKCCKSATHCHFAHLLFARKQLRHILLKLQDRLQSFHLILKANEQYSPKISSFGLISLITACNLGSHPISPSHLDNTFLKLAPNSAYLLQPHHFEQHRKLISTTNKTNGWIKFSKKDSFVNIKQKGTIYFTKGHSFISP